ncbi:hypothetical protein VNO77_43924 [Canavalia gladiata]|uniref:Uncharacterized protein n=1 Tax=Canavalia gladiata TaxID=3824 RepID=A0AAN9JV42_CANGL
MCRCYVSGHVALAIWGMAAVETEAQPHPRSYFWSFSLRGDSINGSILPPVRDYHAKDVISFPKMHIPIASERLCRPLKDVNQEVGSGCGIFYVPQHPYTCMGKLRDQIIYHLSCEEAKFKSIEDWWKRYVGLLEYKR